MSLEHQSQPDLMAVLKDKLKESGRSINAVATKAGVTPGGVAHAFKHDTGMNIRNYQRLAKELGFTLTLVETTPNSEDGIDALNHEIPYQ